jgi:hypothetical protein
MSADPDLGYWLFVALLIASGFALAAHALCLDLLRKRHESEWDRLGRPTFFRQDLESLPARLRFFYAGGFVRVRDAMLTALCVAKLAIEVLALILAALLVWYAHTSPKL